MSKSVGCIVNELEESEIIDDDFGLFVIFLEIDESGEIGSTESVEPITKIGFDIENEDCLLHVSDGKEALKISDAYPEIVTFDSQFSLVCSIEQQLDDTWVRIDNPIIGFGENVDEKRFFVVCRA